MKKAADRKIARWERRRNVGQEILQGIRDIKAGRVGRRFTAESYAIVRARERSSLSQSQFAALLGMSVWTLQELEQRGREPSAATQTLIKFAQKHPRVLRELAP